MPFVAEPLTSSVRHHPSVAMNIEAAEATSILLCKINAALDAQLAAMQPHCEEAEYRQQRRLFGQVMAATFEILNPIYTEYPSLKPRQLGGSYDLSSSALAVSTANLVNGA